MEKIKIILVDDELPARSTIKAYLEYSDTYEIVADFTNARAALDWLRKNQVDLMLCDMQMPGIDGVELMRSVHIIDEYLPVIAISGYDDFDYVRGSLVNGAANYLLKHELTKEKLLEALDQVREKYRIVPIETELQRRKGYCFSGNEEFSAEKIRELSGQGKIDFYCSNVVPVAISPDYQLQAGVNPEEYKHDICKIIIDMLGQILGDKYPYIVYEMKNHHLVLMCSFVDERSMLSMINMQTNLVGRLQRQIIRMLGLTVTMITGEVHGNIESAVSEVLQMEALLADKLYLGGNRISSFAVTKGISYDNGRLPENLRGQFVFEIENGMESCLDTAGEMLEYMKQKRFSGKRVYESCREILEKLRGPGLLEEEEEKGFAELMREYEEYEQFRNLVLEAIHKALRDSRQKRTEPYSEPVGRVMEYVRENLAEDISLEKCAQLVGSSYAYLSREFKKETGMRFVEFLNRQRVKKAKSLLIRGDYSMKQIVERSGFRNYNYFFKVFKEMEGVTPSEFIQTGSKIYQ